jgi:hypothetical protein
MRALVATLSLAAACGPAVRPDAPDPAAEAPVGRPAPRSPSANPGRQYLVAEMCPAGAAGRPAVAPLFLRGVGWSADADQVAAPLARGAVGQLAVLAIDGRRAGVFSVVGMAEVGDGDVGIGSYSGAAPCSRAQGDKAVDDAACLKALAGCGLAFAAIEPGQDAFADAPAQTPQTGAACVSGDVLAVDIDGDGAIETYPVSQLLDAVRVPAEEVSAVAVAAPSCKPTYAQVGIRLTPGMEPGRAVEARHVVDLDVLGVIDVDGDGRRELFLGFRYPEGQGRTIAVYSATSSAGRLELVGETSR